MAGSDPPPRSSPRNSSISVMEQFRPAQMSGSEKHSVLKFKLGQEVTKSIRFFLESRGWTEFVASEHNDDDFDRIGDWHLFWQDKRLLKQVLRNCRDDSRVNKFPNTRAIVRKDLLALHYMNLREAYPEAYNFHPKTYLISSLESEDMGKFQEAFEEQAKLACHFTEQGITDGRNGNVWICKPSASHRGKGIYVFGDMEKLKSQMAEQAAGLEKNTKRGRKTSLINQTMRGQNSVVVQRYLANPALIEGYKFDIRVYVLVTSFWPLRCYMYREVIGRLGTAKYNMDDLDDVYSHLTNASINKKNAKELSEEEKKVLGGGAKWTTERLWDYLKGKGYIRESIWRDIRKLALLSLLPLIGEIPADFHCFEVFGYDVMLDNLGKPWLLEINRSPAMVVACEADQAKQRMLTDMFNMLDFENTLLNKDTSGWRDAERDPGGFELLFPFNQATQAANDALVSTEMPPTIYGINVTHVDPLTSVRIWSEKEGEEENLFFGTEDDESQGSIPPWRRMSKKPPSHKAAVQFRRQVILEILREYVPQPFMV